MATHDPINPTEARVLAVLAPGGTLSARELARDANLAQREAVEAAARMSLLGLVDCRPTNDGDLWEMSQRGRGWAATSIGRATMEVPGFKVGR